MVVVFLTKYLYLKGLAFYKDITNWLIMLKDIYFFNQIIIYGYRVNRSYWNNLRKVIIDVVEQRVHYKKELTFRSSIWFLNSPCNLNIIFEQQRNQTYRAKIENKCIKTQKSLYVKKWDHDKKTHESTLLQEASVKVFAILAKNVWEENFRRLFSYFYVKHSKAPTLSRHCGTTISPGIIFWTNTNVNLTWKCVHTIFSNFNERVSKMRSLQVYSL